MNVDPGADLAIRVLRRAIPAESGPAGFGRRPRRARRRHDPGRGPGGWSPGQARLVVGRYQQLASGWDGDRGWSAEHCWPPLNMFLTTQPQRELRMRDPQPLLAAVKASWMDTEMRPRSETS